MHNGYITLQFILVTCIHIYSLLQQHFLFSNSYNYLIISSTQLTASSYAHFIYIQYKPAKS